MGQRRCYRHKPERIKDSRFQKGNTIEFMWELLSECQIKFEGNTCKGQVVSIPRWSVGSVQLSLMSVPCFASSMYLI